MPEFEPSDWKSTRVPKLSQLDSLLRCVICKDFLKAPVITSCNHTFCSQCIRQHLLNVSRCPLCKAEQFESNLKRVILLEEIVLSFQANREDLISLATTENELRDSTAKDEDDDLEIVAVIDEKSGNTKTLDSESESPEISFASCPVCNKKMHAEHLQRSHLDYCLKGKPDPKLISGGGNSKRKRNDVSSFFQKQTKAKQTSSEIDHEQFYFGDAEKHHHNTKRIPKIDFSSLSTAKVKEKLTALKLPTSGSRTQMEMRYNQYYILQNSNLDSNHPQTNFELRQKLNQWEKSSSAFSAQFGGGIFSDSLSHRNLADKDFPIKAWLETYKDEFKYLTKIAKRSKKRRKVSDDTSSAECTNESLHVSSNGHNNI